MPVELIASPQHDRQRSLGWLAVSWLEHFCLYGPGDIQGTPLNAARGGIALSDELSQLTADVYAHDENGRRLYDSAFYSRPKGADKSGHAARIALFEALGPCRFAGWAEGGETFEWMDFVYEYHAGDAMGRPVTYPFLRIMATEEEQAGNVYDTIHYNLTEGPLSQVFRKKGDVGLTRVFLPGGGEIRPSTASNAAKDGGLETFANFDETHLYITPELRRMHATVRRNLTKREDSEPWSLEDSTMYQPGQDSIAERAHDRAKQIRDGKIRAPRAYFNHRQAPADVDLADEASLRAGLAEAYGDAASYTDFDRKVTEIWDPLNDVNDSRRYFLNQVTAHSQAWLAPHEWDRLEKPLHFVPDGAQVTLGFDGSKSGDWTALIGCEVETGHLFRIAIWNPEDYDGEIPREQVDDAVRGAFARFDVVAFFSDVAPWQSYIDVWAQELGGDLCVKASPKHAVGWDMRARRLDTTQAAEEFHAAVLDGDLSHDGNGEFAQHVYNARRGPNQYGISFYKETPDSAKKIDAAWAAVLARKARQNYLALPDNKKRRRRTGKAMFAG